jgi:hypothetical protein
MPSPVVYPGAMRNHHLDHQQPIVATAARMIGSSNPLRGEEGGQGEGEGRQARFAALVLKP